MADEVRSWVAIVGVQVTDLAIELPQVYHKKIETDQNDLIQLSAVVGAICSEFKNVPQKIYLPAEWKGQAPKDIIHRRAENRLSPEELAKIPLAPRSKKRNHNTMDGVSIGLVFLRRL